jgi:hypothetical protein
MAPVWPHSDKQVEEARHHHSPGPRFLAKPHWTPPVPHDAFDTAGTAHTSNGTYVKSHATANLKGSKLCWAARASRSRGALETSAFGAPRTWLDLPVGLTR